ncbi:MAG: hypothetical protein IPN59_09070 [Holophaga sp.]|nr:hypothetical protein [Holophaga sp.]
MRHLTFALAAILALPIVAQTPSLIPVANPGFEQAVKGQPADWTIALAPGAKVTTSGDYRAEGSLALRLEHAAEGGSSHVLSAPVGLQVGQLYRLSGWIKAKGVKTDPTARYPTALGACLSMASFPFTNASPTVAGDGDRRVSVTFFATTAKDRVRLDLGRNGKATGSAWFDDLKLEKLDDITQHIPLETVRWAGKGFRYDEGGWSFVHIEGEPYTRGVQYGRLVATELAKFLDKLAVLQDAANPEKGWSNFRVMADSMMLRKYDPEFLEEMKGIADGAAKAGATFRGRAVDLLDIVTANSAIDLGELSSANRVSETALTGRSFQPEDDTPGKRTDRCSAFVATKSATQDGRFITGQMFMWPPSYSGVHWDVILDVVPTKGHRFVMQTFPGGISSGTDWYINTAGIVIGETTVAQTPFEPEGTPQSNRIRKAAQYSSSIDDVARILTDKNNGLYTNDWTIADTKTDEGAVFLLGTKKTKLWRTGSKGHAADTPGNLKDFVWANNNNREIEVRKELVPNPENVPVDLAFRPMDRDIALYQWFQEKKAPIDLTEAIRFWATSPVQRPHACDGKLTTAEMAEKLMFIAHQGKTTHREKWVGGRWIPDLPNAVPHLTYGYTTFSPIFVADKLKEAKDRVKAEVAPAPEKRELAKVKDLVAFDKKALWLNTVYPASDAENWLSSGDAAYHALLKRLPEDPAKAFDLQRDFLAELNARALFLLAREADLVPLNATTVYDRFGAYHLPRIKGTFALHQLRLWLGNATFAKIMAKVHGTYAGKPIRTGEFFKVASEAAGRDVRPLMLPWLERTGLPDPSLVGSTAKTDEGFEVKLTVWQKGQVYPFVATVAVATAKGTTFERVEINNAEEHFTFKCADKPIRITFNAGNEIPVASALGAQLTNLQDDWERLLYVPGTSHQIEANRSLIGVFREQVADNMTEVLPEIRPDAEVLDPDLKNRDLVIFGGIEENNVLARLAEEGKLPVEFGKGYFRFQGRTYAKPEEGIAFAVPNPWNPRRMLYVYSANSRLQLWQMTKGFQRGLPGWTLWKGGDITSRGFHGSARMTLSFE